MAKRRTVTGWDPGILLRLDNDEVYYIPSKDLDKYRVRPGRGPHAPTAAFNHWFDCLVQLSGVKNAISIDWEFTPLGDGVGVEHMVKRDRKDDDED